MRMETAAVSDHPGIEVVTANGTGVPAAQPFGIKAFCDALDVDIY
jgi:hypothetical protein